MFTPVKKQLWEPCLENTYGTHTQTYTFKAMGMWAGPEDKR